MLPDDEVELLDALLAGGQLPDGRPDLPAGQPAAARAADGRAHQAPPARPLGHVARPEPPLRPPQPGDPRHGQRRDLRGRSGPRRPGPRRQRLPRGHLLGDLPATSRRDDGGLQHLFRQFSTPGGIPSHVSVTDAGLDPRGRRARLRAGPRLRRGLRQPRPHRGVRRRRRRGRDRPARGLVEGHPLPQPGPRRRRAPDPAPQRLQDRRADRARARPATTRSARCSPVTATTCASSRATTRPRCTRTWPPRSTTASAPIRAIQDDARGGTASGSRRAGRPSCCAPRRAGPGPKEVDGLPVEGTFRAHQVPVERRPRRTPSTWPDARGVDAQLPARGAVRRDRAAACPSSPRWPRRATGAWAPTRTPTAARS